MFPIDKKTSGRRLQVLLGCSKPPLEPRLFLLSPLLPYHVGFLNQSHKTSAIKLGTQGQRLYQPHWSRVSRKARAFSDPQPNSTSVSSISSVSHGHPGRQGGWRKSRCLPAPMAPQQNCIPYGQDSVQNREECLPWFGSGEELGQQGCNGEQEGDLDEEECGSWLLYLSLH